MPKTIVAEYQWVALENHSQHQPIQPWSCQPPVGSGTWSGLASPGQVPKGTLATQRTRWLGDQVSFLQASLRKRGGQAGQASPIFVQGFIQFFGSKLYSRTSSAEQRPRGHADNPGLGDPTFLQTHSNSTLLGRARWSSWSRWSRWSRHDSFHGRFNPPIDRDSLSLFDGCGWINNWVRSGDRWLLMVIGSLLAIDV